MIFLHIFDNFLQPFKFRMLVTIIAILYNIFQGFSVSFILFFVELLNSMVDFMGVALLPDISLS